MRREFSIVLFSVLIFSFATAARAEEPAGYFDSERLSPADSSPSSRTEIKPSVDGEADFSEEDESPYNFTGFLREGIYGAQSALPEGERLRKELLSSYTRLRLDAAFESGDGRLAWKASGNFDGIFSNFSDSPEFDLYYKTHTRNRLLSLEAMRDEDEYLLRADVHRLWVRYSFQSLDLKLGRQAISWGEGRLLNPLDLITPTGPFITDLEDIAGADALYALYSLNNTDTIEFVLLPYRRLDRSDLSRLYYKDTNALARYKATRGDLDASVLGGHHFHSWVGGGELTLTKFGASFRAAYLGRSEYRLENYPFYEKDRLPPRAVHQGSLGASYTFFKKLHTTFELLLNSGYTNRKDRALEQHREKEFLIDAGLDAPDARDSSFFRTSGRLITKNPYLPQLALDLDFFDAWNLSLIFIGDPEGKSLFLGPGLRWNFSDEGVWVLGAQLFEEYDNQGLGEFEGLPPLVYTYARFHF